MKRVMATQLSHTEAQIIWLIRQQSIITNTMEKIRNCLHIRDKNRASEQERFSHLPEKSR